MKTRNEIYGGTFSSPEAPDTNTNGELKKLVLSDSADITKNRSSWIRTIFYNIMDSFTHKTEDRATGTDIGVTGAGIEPTLVKYVTPEQLPEVDKTTNDFSTPAKSDANGALTTTQDLFNVATTTVDRKSKKYTVNLSAAGVLFFKARTWLETEIQDLIDTSTAPILPAANDYSDSVLSTYLATADSYTKTTSSNGTPMSVNVVGSPPFTFTDFAPFYTYIIRKKICTLNFKISFTVSDGAVIDLIRIPLPVGVVKDITDGESYSNYGTFYLTAPLATSDYGSGRVKSIGDGSEGQTFELRRSESGKDFTIDTSSVVTLEGFITFKVV